jgi:hypothetical protein
MTPVNALSTSAIAAIGKTQCESVSAGDIAIFSFTHSLLPISSITVSIFDQCNSVHMCQCIRERAVGGRRRSIGDGLTSPIRLLSRAISPAVSSQTQMRRRMIWAAQRGNKLRGLRNHQIPGGLSLVEDRLQATNESAIMVTHQTSTLHSRDTAARQSKICNPAHNGMTLAAIDITSSSSVKSRGSRDRKLASSVMLNKPIRQAAQNAFGRVSGWAEKGHPCSRS